MSKFNGHINVNITSPCKDCAERQLGCHDKCGKYKAYKSEIETTRNSFKKENTFCAPYYAVPKRRHDSTNRTPASVIFRENRKARYAS